MTYSRQAPNVTEAALEALSGGSFTMARIPILPGTASAAALVAGSGGSFVTTSGPSFIAAMAAIREERDAADGTRAATGLTSQCGHDSGADGSMAKQRGPTDSALYNPGSTMSASVYGNSNSSLPLAAHWGDAAVPTNGSSSSQCISRAHGMQPIAPLLGSISRQGALFTSSATAGHSNANLPLLIGQHNAVAAAGAAAAAAAIAAAGEAAAEQGGGFQNSCSGKLSCTGSDNAMLATWLVQEYADCGTLRNFVSKWDFQARLQDDAEAVVKLLALLADTADGLAALHAKNVVHSDLVRMALALSACLPTCQTACHHTAAITMQSTCLLSTHPHDQTHAELTQCAHCQRPIN